MTDEQRNMVYSTWNEIRRLPGSDLIEFCGEGFSIIRMEYIPKRKFYRLANIGRSCGRTEIRNRMMEMYHLLMQDIGREKK